MNDEERVLARILFKNKILESDGQAFEDVFTKIMNYAEEDFQQIKPWGNIGDRKNDGYIEPKGIFYQVFAPENIEKSYPKAVKKLEEDFWGLKNVWKNIREFYFVVNDKYKGVNPDSEIIIRELKITHKLEKSAFKTAKDLENALFSLDDDEIRMIIGHSLEVDRIKEIDYSVLSEVIDYIMHIPFLPEGYNKLTLPDWEDKIEYNKLEEFVKTKLDSAYIHLPSLNVYLKNNSNFFGEELRDRINRIYVELKKSCSGSELFWNMLMELSPSQELKYHESVMVIMAKYFETCDIFEEPVEEGTK